MRLKKFLIVLLSIVLVTLMLLCSCNGDPVDTNTDTGAETDSSSDTNTSSDKGTDTSSGTQSDKETDTNKDTGTDTSSDSKDTSTNKDDDKNDNDSSFDTVLEHKITVEDVLDTSIFDSANTFGQEGSGVDYTGVTSIDVSVYANKATYNITSGGVYRLHGKTTNGQILIKPSDSVEKKVVLILDNLEMTAGGTKAVIYAEKCSSLTIIIPEGTTTTLTDSSGNLDKGVIHVKSCDLTLNGKGTLNLNANGEKARGIFNTKNLTIEGGIYNVTTAISHGIQGEQGLVINGGTFNITSAKSGLKTGDYDEDAIEEAVEGKIEINGGSFNITSATNGISAYGSVTINNGRIVLNADSDGIDSSLAVAINGGITIVNSKKDGIKSDEKVSFSGAANVKISSNSDGVDAADLEINTSGVIYIITNATFVEDPNGDYIYRNKRYQKVEDKSRYPNEVYYSLESCKGFKIDNAITISKGNIGVTSFEDCIDAKSITIGGGKIVLHSEDDAIQVNSTVKANGGTLEILRSNKGIKAAALTVANDAFITVLSSSDAVDCSSVKVSGGVLFLLEKLDVGDGVFEVTGGTVIVLSTTNKPATPTMTTLKSISVTLKKTDNCIYGKWLNISDGENMIALRLPKNYSAKMSVACISADIDSGSYTIGVGTYQVGEKINTFVCTDGEFTSVYTTTVVVE